MSLADELLTATKPPRQRWIDKLDTEAQDDLYAVRTRYQAGKYELSKQEIARRCVGEYKLTVSVQQVATWLGESSDAG